MKVLLANIPWAVESGKYGVRAGSRWAHTRDRKTETITYYPFPFFLAYATAVLKKNGVDAKIKDCITEGVGKEGFFEFLQKEEFDAVIIETSTASAYNDLNMAKEMKGRFGAKIIFCGPHASALHTQLMKENGFIDFIMYGEYDYTALDLVKTMERNGDIGEVKGIAYRKGKTVKVNPRRELIKNLDELPLPERETLPMEKYNEPFCKFYPNVQMITSRGCPNNCIFCLEPSVYYGMPNMRLKRPEKVVDEIEYLIERYRPKEIYFDDASLTLLERHVREVAEEVIRRGIKVKWSCMGDAKVSYETLKIMRDAGCIGIKFGVESADPQILRNIRKFINLDDVLRMVGDCKKLGLYTHATYMFGLPGETEESIKRTIAFSAGMRTDTAQFSVAMPYPGTDFFSMAEKNGWLLTRDWSRYDGSNCSVISYPSLPKETIERAVLKAKKRLFLNVLRNPRTLGRYIESSYRKDGVKGILKNAAWKAKFILEH